MDQMNQLAEEVEEVIFRQQGQEVSSRFIGEQVMSRLRNLDKVAYVRFASVYHEFADLGQFISEVEDVLHRPPESPDQPQLFEG